MLGPGALNTLWQLILNTSYISWYQPIDHFQLHTTWLGDLQNHETALAALEKAKKAHKAAQAALRQPCFLQQPYWCDGLGASASALDAWVEAGLPLKAVVHLKAPQEGEQAKDTPPLIAGTATFTAVITAAEQSLFYYVIYYVLQHAYAVT